MSKREENTSNGDDIIILIVVAFICAILFAVFWDDTIGDTNFDTNSNNIAISQNAIKKRLKFDDLNKSIVRSFEKNIFTSNPYKKYIIQIIDKKGEVDLEYKGLPLKKYLKFEDGKVNSITMYMEKYIVNNKEKELNYFTRVECDLYIHTSGKSNFEYIKYMSGNSKCELHLTRKFIEKSVEYNED